MNEIVEKSTQPLLFLIASVLFECKINYVVQPLLQDLSE